MSLTTLPAVLARLAEGTISDFPALRTHQRHAWHAFLVQLAALALLHAREESLPTNEVHWSELLRALTPAWPSDEPWHLVSEHDQPAILQAPVPDGELTPFKNRVECPDALDMLVTAKNHDLKAARMGSVQPDDWFFALLTLQTMSAYSGATLYNVSRMKWRLLQLGPVLACSRPVD